VGISGPTGAGYLNLGLQTEVLWLALTVIYGQALDPRVETAAARSGGGQAAAAIIKGPDYALHVARGARGCRPVTNGISFPPNNSGRRCSVGEHGKSCGDSKRISNGTRLFSVPFKAMEAGGRRRDCRHRFSRSRTITRAGNGRLVWGSRQQPAELPPRRRLSAKTPVWRVSSVFAPGQKKRGFPSRLLFCKGHARKKNL